MSNVQAGFDLEAFAAKQKGGGGKVKYESPDKDGIHYYHILPPVSKTNRQLSHTYNTHWVANGGDKKIQVACTYYTERNCPLCNAHKEVDDRLKGLQKLSKEGQSVDAGEMKTMETLEWQLRKGKNVYYTAANVNNELIVLKLSSTVSGLLDKVIARLLTEEAFDPTNPKTGAWVRFERNGKGREAVTVSAKENVVDYQGRKLKETDRSPLTDELIAKMDSTDGPDIHDSEQMYVKHYTASELSAFLQGVQLPIRRPLGQSGDATTLASNSVLGRDEALTTTTSNPAQDSQPQATVAPEATTQAIAPATPANGNLAAEIERLRALTVKK